MDRVAVIPTGMLRRGGLITDERLPFDVEVVRYMVNSDLVDAKPGTANDADRGQGLRIVALDRPEGVGVDPDQKIDLASAYVTLKRKDNGTSLGTFMVSVLLLDPERIVVDGKPYEISLRFKRCFRPYTFRLDKLNVEFYQNTDVPKDYSSFIHLTDPEQKIPEEKERDVRIWMNNPLTYRGETFYQSGVHQDEMNRWRMTTLQVVSNPGWALPYLSCLLVASGMLFHFGLTLARFLQRRAA